LEETGTYLFSGTYEHSLDDKSRLTIPSVFRKDFAGGVVLRKDREGCVEVLPRAAWEQFLAKLQAVPRTDQRAQRWLTQQLAAAVLTELDKQGRVVLSGDQKAHAGLQAGPVVVTGALDRLKVWNPQRWTAMQRETESEDLDGYIYETYQI
jgi:MraZ protein